MVIVAIQTFVSSIFLAWSILNWPNLPDWLTEFHYRQISVRNKYRVTYILGLYDLFWTYKYSTVIGSNNLNSEKTIVIQALTSFVKFLDQ